jgi:hypothetical protein
MAVSLATAHPSSPLPGSPVEVGQQEQRQVWREEFYLHVPRLLALIEDSIIVYNPRQDSHLVEICATM